MRKGYTSRVLIAAVFSALITGAFLSPAAQAVTDTIFKYTSPKTGYLMLGPGDFVPDAGTTAYLLDDFSVNAAAGGVQCFHAGVHLPQVATMTQVRVFYMRPAEVDVVYAAMRRISATGNTNAYVFNGAGDLAPVDADGGVVTYPAVASVAVVNNQQYHYALSMCLQGSGRLFHVRVDYTYTNAGS